MADPIVEKAQAWLREHEQDLLDDTRRMLRIPSVETAAEPGAPFGKANREALDLALNLANTWGMRTKDLDGYCGYAEFGKGERLIVSLGHLDVVPVSSGWKHEPFGAEIDGEYVYARGSVDDKGPTMASFYAARALMEVAGNLGARVRIVFGCDEESGFQCVHRYVQTEEAPTYGIAPDSDWPLIHAEKGICDLHVEVPLPTGEFALMEANGGQRPNIVIDACSATVRVGAGARAHVDEKLADAWDRNVAFRWHGDMLRVETVGKACHGSIPFGGDSAAIRLFRFLAFLAPLEDETFYDELLWSAHLGGAGLGIAGADEVSKDLTCNLGIVSTDGSTLKLLFNIRYPVTWKGEAVQKACGAHLETLKSGWSLAEMTDSPSLYFPIDHPLVSAICEVVREETGETKAPGVMGGGTYARAIPNTVSVGTGWAGDGDAHENDERLKVEHLYRMSRIYAHILYRLARLESS